jgi:hypothetical protein
MEKTMKEENDRFRADLGAEKKARAAEQVARLKVELEVGELKEQIATMQADLLTNHALRSSPIGASSTVIVPGKALPGTSSTGSGVLATGLLGAGIPGLTVQQLLPGVPTAGEKALQIEVEKLKTDLAAERKAREEWAAFVPASLGASEREARIELEAVKAEASNQKRFHIQEAAALRAELELAWTRAKEIAQGFAAEVAAAETMRAELEQAEAEAHKEEVEALKRELNNELSSHAEDNAKANAVITDLEASLDLVKSGHSSDVQRLLIEKEAVEKERLERDQQLQAWREREEARTVAYSRLASRHEEELKRILFIATYKQSSYLGGWTAGQFKGRLFNKLWPYYEKSPHKEIYLNTLLNNLLSEEEISTNAYARILSNMQRIY